jgi:CelD/BcsL family acetyltransferase involved in cellulose biosynthesis
MAALPILDEVRGSTGSPMLAGVAGRAKLDPPAIEPTFDDAITMQSRERAARRLSVYRGDAGTYLVDELEHLCRRSVEPNVFFNPRFLAPAMLRLEDKDIRFAVVRDFRDEESRIRLLFPFSVEKPGLQFGPSIIRSWATPYGPLGTPLIDSDDPVSVLEDFFDMTARRHLNLPPVLVLPDMRSQGPVTALFKTIAMGRNLPLHIHDRQQRPILKSPLDGESYLRASIGAHHWRDHGRLRRKLEAQGHVTIEVARTQAEVLRAVEIFLSLEAAGWKGRERTAMAIDRFRAAFAREAIYSLAAEDRVRIHVLSVGGKPIGAMVVFVEAGIAYTWKTAYDEAYAKYSPGNMLLIELTKNHLDDPNIMVTDSCAVPDHPVMSRFWTEREAMETLIIGMSPAADRQARQVAKTMHLYRQTRDLAKRVRNAFFKRR